MTGVRRSEPLTATLELTLRCNWSCRFCYNPRHHDNAPLSLPEWELVFDDLRSMGALHVTLTGGEPMLHPQFFDVARAARRRHFAVTIFTNGSLVDVDTAAEMRRLAPYVVELSLHGATAAVHDAATRRKGSFDAVLGAVEKLKREGVRLHLKTVLTSSNEAQLEAMTELARALEVSFSIDPVVKPRDDGGTEPLQYRASPEARRRAFEHARATGGLPTADRAVGEPNCGLGMYVVSIDAEGNVYACPRWRVRPLGNVREARLTELWRTSPARQEALEVARRVPGELARFDHANVPFCPGNAVSRTGSPFVPSDEFLENARFIDLLR